ncbi:hypothetical protein [Streptomyces marincola]|uniref:Secreted protein n=1 Tax=Streptomyces marincola TaxID=2878388 RepID=A0A1W7CWG1_9ACTN|nr:hypothetical protein [Streptomyces marincola]ARQ69141.1 hypothetical protein CAG99_09935 [Streptomyces marincola]
MGLRKLAGSLLAVAAASLALAGPAHASASPSTVVGEKMSPATLSTGSAQAQAQAQDMSAQNVHCVNPSFNFDGNQWYFYVACSSTGTTQWWAVITCSDGSLNAAGPHTGFRSVQVYCPPGTTPVEAWVEYTP